MTDTFPVYDPRSVDYDPNAPVPPFPHGFPEEPPPPAPIPEREQPEVTAPVDPPIPGDILDEPVSDNEVSDD